MVLNVPEESIDLSPLERADTRCDIAKETLMLHYRQDLKIFGSFGWACSAVKHGHSSSDLLQPIRGCLALHPLAATKV